MQTSKINRLCNGVVCVLLMVCLLFSSFFNVRKAEAIAPAIPAAGAALAALAADLGISETALMAGIAVTGIAATGLVAYGNAGTDTSLPPAPGFKPWDDLTPQEKQDWVGQNGNALDYQKQTIAWWALQYGMLEQTPNGDLQPSPEPDPDNDPDGNSRWNKARNALIALAVGGASIPLSDALGSFADGIAGGVKKALFGDGSASDATKSLVLPYSAKYDVENVLVEFCTYPGSTIGNQVQYADTWEVAQVFSSEQVNYYGVIYNGTKENYDLVFSENNTFPDKLHTSLTYVRGNNSNGGTSSTRGNFTIPTYNGKRTFLNAMYEKTYTFPNGSYSGGVMNGYDIDTIDYGQLSDTPEGLSQSIINNNNYNNWINNYSDPGVEGYERAVTIPAGYGQSGYEPNYSDFVVVKPDGDVTPLPDDGQIEVPNPDNPSNPDTPTTEYEQEFGQRVGELLAKPFDQLFPFCLVGDLREFLGILEEAGFGSNDQNGGMRALSDEPVNGIDVIRLDLTGFNVEGADYFEIDLKPVHDFAVGFRGISTSVFIIMLLIGTFRFFINRGGE